MRVYYIVIKEFENDYGRLIPAGAKGSCTKSHFDKLQKKKIVREVDKKEVEPVIEQETKE